jgi:uncharacterized membrane protein YsdA (DUF1294 family)
MMRFILALVALCAVIAGVLNLFLYAADREAEFQDNIRISRCEKMDDFERNRMKGYCD